eukprot:scaffold90_cov264-Pinguiococcus_pyrenoidosus.AAC.19
MVVVLLDDVSTIYIILHHLVVTAGREEVVRVLRVDPHRVSHLAVREGRNALARLHVPEPDEAVEGGREELGSVRAKIYVLDTEAVAAVGPHAAPVVVNVPDLGGAIHGAGEQKMPILRKPADLVDSLRMPRPRVHDLLRQIAGVLPLWIRAQARRGRRPAASLRCTKIDDATRHHKVRVPRKEAVSGGAPCSACFGSLLSRYHRGTHFAVPRLACAGCAVAEEGLRACAPPWHRSPPPQSALAAARQLRPLAPQTWPRPALPRHPPPRPPGPTGPSSSDRRLPQGPAAAASHPPPAPAAVSSSSPRPVPGAGAWRLQWHLPGGDRRHRWRSPVVVLHHRGFQHSSSGHVLHAVHLHSPLLLEWVPRPRCRRRHERRGQIPLALPHENCTQRLNAGLGVAGFTARGRAQRHAVVPGPPALQRIARRVHRRSRIHGARWSGQSANCGALLHGLFFFAVVVG